jgi:hypothetical protein
MGTQLGSRWLSGVVIIAFGAVMAAACGGSGGTGLAPSPDASFATDDSGMNGFGGGDDSGGGGNTCVKTTCASLGYTCGMNTDGCGGLQDCGTCATGELCGAAGFSKCGSPTPVEGGTSTTDAGMCVSKTCADLDINCGYTGDGCNNALNCGTCTTGEFCGGGGFNKCGTGTTATDAAPMTCTATTCAAKGYTCGVAADGCGGVLNCGTCTNPEYCGGGGFDVCGGNNGLTADGGIACTPTTCAALGFTCGIAADGCGGVLDCGTCSNPEFCGGGGYDKCGGDNGLTPDGAIACTPQSCAQLGYTCGVGGDGCGGTISCGSCTNPQYCGGGGYNKCGGNNGLTADGGVACTPKTCAQLGYTCGVSGDGCGGSIMCGSCTNPLYCGGGGFNKCGGNNGLTPDGGVACTPTTCAALGYNCGQAADGCGGLLNCGSCTNPEFCGGGGYDTCGGNDGLTPDGGVACTAKTCASLGYTCGASGDGCGGVINCGTCTAPQFCGGGGFDTCGPTSISVCDGGATTTVTGFLYDPANVDPIYNALIYVPLGTVQTPTTGISTASPVCGCTSPPNLASAFTGIDGKFTITVPANTSLTLVAQLGKWQRSFTQTIQICKSNTLSTHLTLPSTSSQGHIPLFAVDTGNVDTMECVLRKMGIADSEFVDPALDVGTRRHPGTGLPLATGRVHLYKGTNYAGGAIIDNSTPGEGSLTETAAVMDSYDVILFPCQGGEAQYNNNNGFPNTLGNLLSYANAGGRVFATHFNYTLLYTNGTATTGFEATANWTLNKGTWDGPFTGKIDTSFARGQALSSWLNQAAVYGGTAGQIPVDVIRNDFSSAVAPAQQWVYTTNPPDQGISPMDIHYTFDTPFKTTASGGAAGTCGRVVFSDFHVEDASNDGSKNKRFPTECNSDPMTPQEKLLEFMLFDLTSCVTPPACKPLTCAQQNLACGSAGDGCGGTLSCGSCPTGQTCGGGGVAGQCGTHDGGSCQAQTCAQQGFTCGLAGDGCGGTLSCGNCPAGQTCGGGGVAGKCGAPDGGGCVATSCAAQNITCGPAGDGCGNLLGCGTCTAPLTCGGGGVPGQCGFPDSGTCASQSCSAQGLTCGPAGDGCGNLLNCGTCMAPATCGGGGVAGKCGSPDGGACKPLTCGQQGVGCGPAGDGCGNLLSCGTCPAGQSCGGGGVPGQCGSPDSGACQPVSCLAQGLNCGPTGDGCGNQISCGTCPAGQACGGGGVPGKCGAPDSGTCVPSTCQLQNIACGPTGDGCGSLIQCGNCPTGQTCGGGGVTGQCGAPTTIGCVPLTCAQQNLNCGPAGDGCGNLIQCGTCSGTDTCGGAGTPGVCGTMIIR